MRRVLSVVACLALALAACGGDSDTTDSEAATTSGPATTAPDPTTTTTPPPSTTAAPTTTTEAEPTGPELVLVLDDEGFGASHALTGPIVEHEGQFHVFHIAAESNFMDIRIAHAVSDDGLAWTMADDRLLTADDVAFAEAQILPSSVIVLEDGTWVMYFHTQEGLYGTDGSVIGLATAPDASGPWTVASEPVLEPAGEGSWDDQGVANPHVLARDGAYVMWYDGHSGDRYREPDRSIGVAQSDDGLTWTRVGTDPVLTPGAEGSWDELRVFDPNVVATEDGLVMSYATMRVRGSQNNNGYGLAVSTDGTTWSRQTVDDAYLWLITDDGSLVPGLMSSLGSTMVSTPDGPLMYFDLLFSGRGHTYAMAPPIDSL